ncbi:hypothetical protein FOZ62_015938, partial [Perkinsus olseni]
EEEMSLIERGVKGGQARLAHRARPPKSAGVLPNEAVKALTRMKPSPDSLDREIRDAALTATSLVLRYDNIPPLRAKDINTSLEATELIATVSLGRTKTSENEVRETKCMSPYSCHKDFCMAHWLHRARLRGPESCKLFPRVSLMGTNKFGQIFKASMKRWFPTKINDWNIDRLSAHSFRHSGATILVDAGCEDST